MNEGLIQANNQQDNTQDRNEKQASQEDRQLNFAKYIKQQSYYYQIDSISNNEKYLAVCQQRKIQIYYLKNKRIMKIIKLDDKKKWIIIFKFSNNSRYLIFGDQFGYLSCYDINNNFQLIYNQKIHSYQINDLLIMDDDQIITCTHDLSISITNIKHNQQLLEIKNAHNHVIPAIDFDKSKDFIISCSYDKSIKFFNRKDGKCCIEQQNAHKSIILMIQQSEDNNLISSSYWQLIVWHIDYQKSQLNKLKEFNYNQIYNFTSVLNNNKIVVICYESILILDKDLVVLQSINHSIKMNSYIKTRQLNSLNYIIIPGYQNVQVFKKVRKLLK